MTTIRVHQFTSFKLSSKSFEVVPALATTEAIAAIGGRKLAHSEQEVAVDLVDGAGFYPRGMSQELHEVTARERLATLGFRPARSPCVVGKTLGAAAALFTAATRPSPVQAVSLVRTPHTLPSERKRT